MIICRIITFAAVKQTIFIKNQTPLKGLITCESTYFYGKTISSKQHIFRKTLYDASQTSGRKYHLRYLIYIHNIFSKFLDQFDDYMNDTGFLIMPSIDKTHIDPFEKIKIDIYVYAHTWGVYCDEVTMEINDCLPFAFNVIARVVGMPVEFPFAINTIHSKPTCRYF